MLDLMTLVAALGSGLIAGVFFAFSSFIMQALHKLSGVAGMAAMQSINVVVLNVSFLGVFMGTALISLIALVMSVMNWQGEASLLIVIGALFYIVGCFLVTIVFNVPKNEALAKVSITDSHAPSDWNTYVTTWTRWNTIRTIASLIAAALFTMALSL